MSNRTQYVDKMQEERSLNMAYVCYSRGNETQEDLEIEK
jgi:hypothetical protein